MNYNLMVYRLTTLYLNSAKHVVLILPSGRTWIPVPAG
jgi:hypothetical protein